jgi:hypothetical protein
MVIYEKYQFNRNYSSVLHWDEGRTIAIVVTFENAIIWICHSSYISEIVPCTTVSRKELKDPQHKILGIMVLHAVHGDIRGKRGENHKLTDAFGENLRIPPNWGVTCNSPAYLNTASKFPVTISPVSGFVVGNFYTTFSQAKINPYTTPLLVRTGTRFRFYIR